LPPNQVVQIGSREGVIAAVAEGVGLGIIFDDELPPEARVETPSGAPWSAKTVIRARERLI
jgi:hypothetical protein